MKPSTLEEKLRIESPPAPVDLVLLEGFWNTRSGELAAEKGILKPPSRLPIGAT